MVIVASPIEAIAYTLFVIAATWFVLILIVPNGIAVWLVTRQNLPPILSKMIVVGFIVSVISLGPDLIGTFGKDVTAHPELFVAMIGLGLFLVVKRILKKRG